ncbi:hypothetical protein [Roseiconus lacunae]|uniref:hypothetical protein n=1 Tax=Roseiconus lacunae TaxID=2605694 RepID=UPI001E35E409|nr:hypothetical protein [Roseiconus lacunae]MCD0459137.1 hypothetical protein [Roseiconus lacunae]
MAGSEFDYEFFNRKIKSGFTPYVHPELIHRKASLKTLRVAEFRRCIDAWPYDDDSLDNQKTVWRSIHYGTRIDHSGFNDWQIVLFPDVYVDWMKTNSFASISDQWCLFFSLWGLDLAEVEKTQVNLSFDQSPERFHERIAELRLGHLIELIRLANRPIPPENAGSTRVNKLNDCYRYIFETLTKDEIEQLDADFRAYRATQLLKLPPFLRTGKGGNYLGFVEDHWMKIFAFYASDEDLRLSEDNGDDLTTVFDQCESAFYFWNRMTNESTPWPGL